MKTTSNQEYSDFRKRLGLKIQSLRKSKNMSQEDLASASEVDRVHIGYLEQGRRSASLKMLFAISKALNVETKNLFD